MNITQIKEYKMNQDSFLNGNFINEFHIFFPKQVNKNTKY